MDDQSLVIAGNWGLVLLVGCSHAGLINTIEYARLMTGIDEVYAVIGGTHLGLSDAIRLDETVRALRGFRINKLCATAPALLHQPAFTGSSPDRSLPLMWDSPSRFNRDEGGKASLGNCRGHGMFKTLNTSSLGW